MKKLLLLAALPLLASGANLTVAGIWGRSPVIVYELPDSDGRADAIHYIESVRDSIKPGAKVLDAAAEGAQLPAKLRNGFILYTTLGEKSHLLQLATRKLGWVFANSSADHRFVLVGRNPYSKGWCAIFAAGSNRGLLEINALRQGGASYHVFQRDQLLREGNYDETLVPIERISRAAALDDMHQFFRTLKEVHPNLLAKVTPQDFQHLQEQTAAAIDAKLDSNGTISVEDLSALFYYSAAYFHDGHTAVHWEVALNDLNTRGKRFPAFRLTFDNGRFLIAAATDASVVGSELVELNGVPAVEFFRPILDRCSGETLGFRAARFLGNEPFWYYLTDLFAAGPPQVKLRDRAGQIRELTADTLDFRQYLAFRNQGGAEPFVPNREGTKVEFLDNGATAHFLYSSFHNTPDERKKVDAAFQEIKAKGARNLIFDVRGNGGGRSEMADYIFAYLYAGKFRSISKVQIKVSWRALNQLPVWSRPLALFFRGRTISLSNSEAAKPKPAAFFSGKPYLLIDNGSYSMSGMFAAMWRAYKVGTLVGYETGGLPNTFGGPYRFTLKNSRIPVSVAWTKNFAAKPAPGDDDHGVVPDVLLNDRILADYQSEKDPVLAFTLHYIAANAK